MFGYSGRVNTVNDVRIYPAVSFCVYYHSFSHTFHSQMPIGKKHHPVVIVFWHVTVLLLPHQRLFIPECIQCTSPLHWWNNTGVRHVKVFTVCLSVLLCLIHKGVMEMVAVLLWKCIICLPQEMDLWSFISPRFTAKSIKWQVSRGRVLWWQVWFQRHWRVGNISTTEDAKGTYAVLYAFIETTAAVRWKIYKTNTQHRFIRLHVLSTT